MITGGFDGSEASDSADIIDTDDCTVSLTSPMNSKRCSHGMGVLTIDGLDRLAVFGGKENKASELDCVELYNAKSKKWETTDIKLNGPKSKFGFLTVKLNDIIPELQCTVPDLRN